MKKQLGPFPRIIIIITAFLFIIFIAGLIWIYKDVKNNCREVQLKYKTDCFTALSKIVEDKNEDFQTRNSAVWTLGQLADKRALPVLKKYFTGHIPDKESWSKTLSQYELEKAIRWCEKGNITSWMYRNIN